MLGTLRFTTEQGNYGAHIGPRAFEYKGNRYFLYSNHGMENNYRSKEQLVIGKYQQIERWRQQHCRQFSAPSMVARKTAKPTERQHHRQYIT